MQQINIIKIETEKDIMKDRIISYDEFMEILRFLSPENSWDPPNRHYIFYGLLGITGARPCEVCKFRIDEDFDFSDPMDPKVRVKIGKPVKKCNYIFNEEFEDDPGVAKGHISYVENIQRKIVWRPIPLWFAEQLSKYLKCTRTPSMWLFPTCKGILTHVNPQSIQTTTKKYRDKMNAAGFTWVKDIIKKKRYASGKVQYFYRFSNYSFRKMHAVLYLKMMQDQGDMNAIVATSKHMGHTKIETTLRYLALAINDRENIEKHGFMNQAPTPDHETKDKQIITALGDLTACIRDLKEEIVALKRD